jgi:hypothetical protein
VKIIVTDGRRGKPTLERISHLQMFVQSAELRIVGISPRISLEVSCQLSNIARGTCNLSFRAVDIAPKNALGHIQVPINRPVMNGDLVITHDVFDLMRFEFRHVANRPASIVLALEEEIAVTIHGDLWIETTTLLTVRDLSIVLPLA